jgi:hypothetical protein
MSNPYKFIRLCCDRVYDIRNDTYCKKCGRLINELLLYEMPPHSDVARILSEPPRFDKLENEGD